MKRVHRGINIDMKTGVYVQTVVEKKDAGDALQVGDIITMIDGIEMSSYQDVLARMYMHSAGDTVMYPSSVVVKVSRLVWFYNDQDDCLWQTKREVDEGCYRRVCKAYPPLR